MHLMNFPEDSSAVIQPAFYANTHLFYYSFVFEDTEEVESFLRFTVLFYSAITYPCFPLNENKKIFPIFCNTQTFF